MTVMAGVVAYGESKKYIYPKFSEMAEACILPHAELWVASETEDHGIPCTGTLLMPVGIKNYVEDIIMDGRERLRLHAFHGDYEAYVHQGVDCLYALRDDFKKLISSAGTIVGALTSARNDSTFAVARTFAKFDDKFSEKQKKIDSRSLASGRIIPAGYPGADALIVKREALHVGYEGHIKWYDRVAQGMENLECEEELLLTLSRMGYDIWLDTSIRTWHVHEDMIARMWYGIDEHVDTLSWDAA